MLGCNVKGYKRACAPTTGGTGRLFVGDANDLKFTSGAPADGEKTGYSTVERREGAETPPVLFEIDSKADTILVELNQSNPEDGSPAWEYNITARLAQWRQGLTNFNEKLDAAAQCCQLIFIWQNNDGAIFVAGEKYVDTNIIPPFRLRQDGSKLSSGQKFTDFNGQDLAIKGTYGRPAYEFTGGMAVIEALLEEVIP